MSAGLDSVQEGKLVLAIETLELRLESCRRAELACEHVAALKAHRDRLFTTLKVSRQANSAIAERSVKQAQKAEALRRAQR